MRQRDIFNQFQQFLKGAEGEFHVLEHQVPIEIQMEYFTNSNRLRNFILALNPKFSANDLDYEQFVSELQNPETSQGDKKRILSVLAVSKQIKAYRILEKYLQSPDNALKDWAYMALMESRIALESEFSDEKQVYISTGLGGKGKKLRFYILLLSADGNPFLDYQQKVIEREFAYTLSNEDGEIEQLIMKGNHMEMFVLLPIPSNIKKLVENIMNECNQYGNFLSNAVTVTNVKRLTANEIAQIIEKHENKSSRTGF